MKRSIFILFLSLLFLPDHVLAGDHFVIHGNLKGEAEGAHVHLGYFEGNNQVTLDSTVVKNGQFTLKGTVEGPVMSTLTIDMNDPKDPNPDYRNKAVEVKFYVENSDISVEGDVATLPAVYYNPERTGKPVIKGSASQNVYEKFNMLLQATRDTLNILSERYINEYNVPSMEGKDATDIGIAIVNEEKPYKEQLKQLTLGFIRDNIASPVGFDQAAYAVQDYLFPITAAEFDELMQLMEKNWGTTKQFAKLKSNADKLRRLCIGEKFIDCEFVDTKGKTVKLSSLVPKGKYCMLEFWASWCGPCRSEIPHLKKVMEKYKDFCIISISIDAKDADWQKALKEEGMTWPQLRNPKGMHGATLDIYNIMAVPSCIILNKDGRFYKKDMRGAYLDDFLAETYGRK